jgi:hypothetical protein
MNHFLCVLFHGRHWHECPILQTLHCRKCYPCKREKDTDASTRTSTKKQQR